MSEPDQVQQVLEILRRTNDDISSLVGASRNFAARYGLRIFLGVKSCGRKECLACPHGPYWNQGWHNAATNQWRRKYVATRLTNSCLRRYGIKSGIPARQLKQMDAQARVLRKNKNALVRALKKVRDITGTVLRNIKLKESDGE